MAEGHSVECSSSDTLHEDILLCQPCLDEGNELSAEGYCVTCEEYLCIMCYKTHTKPKPSRNHVLQDKTEMPKTRPKLEPENEDHEIAIKCQTHKELDITSYCKSHDRLCCKNCLVIGHRACNDIITITDIVRDETTTEDLIQQFEQKLESVHRMNEDNKEQMEQNLEDIDLLHSTAIDKVQAALDAVKEKDMAKMASVRSTCETVSQEVQVIQADIKRYREKQQLGNVFILMKQTEKDSVLMEENTKQIAKENSIERYAFVQDIDKKQIGSIVKCPYLIKTINVKHASEENDCDISDMLLLNENFMLVCDDSVNSSLMLIDRKHLQADSIVSRKYFSDSLSGTMTITNKNVVYITQPESQRLLQLPEPSVDLEKMVEIKTDGECCAIGFHDNALRVQFENPHNLLEMDLDGNVLRTIHADTNKLRNHGGEPYLETPFAFTVNETNGTMVFASYSNNSLAEITNEGQAKQLIKSEALQVPCRIVMDTNRAFLVCSRDGHSVIRVTRNGDIQHLITDLDFKPLSLALDRDQRLLYVGGMDTNFIHVYQL